MILTWSPLYLISRLIVATGVLGFYKRFEQHGRENIPKGKPVIFAPNHQAAFMDPVIVASFRPGQTYFLVRADVFKKPLVVWIFKWLKMMPVYRQRDGKDSLEKNQEIFNNCFRILKNNRGLIMFPEGNQQNKKTLRTLKKGVSRVAFGAEEKYNFELDVQIVPVGITYGHHTKRYTTGIVNFGKPIPLSEYKDVFYENEARAFNLVKERMQKEVAELMIDIQDREYYDTIEEIRKISHKKLLTKAGFSKDNLKNELDAGKQFIREIEAWIPENQEDAKILKKEVEAIRTKTSELGLKYHLYNKEKYATLLPTLLLVLLLPIHLVGIVFNYIPWKLPDWFVTNKVRDKHFHSSFKMLGGSFLMFIFNCLLYIPTSLIFGWEIGLICFTTAPIFGLFSFHYYITFLKTKGRVRYNQLKKKKDNRITEILCLKSQVNNILDKIY